jgi:hypothetical protein
MRREIVISVTYIVIFTHALQSILCAADSFYGFTSNSSSLVWLIYGTLMLILETAGICIYYLLLSDGSVVLERKYYYRDILWSLCCQQFCVLVTLFSVSATKGIGSAEAGITDSMRFREYLILHPVLSSMVLSMVWIEAICMWFDGPIETQNKRIGK